MKRFLVASIVIFVVVFVCLAWNNRTLMYVNDEFKFSFKYGAFFNEKYNESTLITLRSDDNSIEMNVVAKKKTKDYSMSIEEMGEGYINLLKAIDQDVEYNVINDKTIEISNGKAKCRKLEFSSKIKDNEEMNIVLLIPLEDREITMVIRASKNGFDRNENRINKIIESIMVY